MKTKKDSKKLVVKKRVLRSLNEEQLAHSVGGVAVTGSDDGGATKSITGSIIRWTNHNQALRRR